MAIFAAAPNEVAYTDGELHPVSRDNADRDALVGDGSFSEMVGKMRQEFDELSVPQVEEILDWQKSQGWLIVERAGTDSVFGTGGAAEDVVVIIKNRDLYWRNFFSGVFHILHSSAQDSKRVSQVLRTLRGRFFEGSAASLVAHLIRSSEVDKRELDEIERVIEQSKREGDER